MKKNTKKKNLLGSCYSVTQKIPCAFVILFVPFVIQLQTDDSGAAFAPDVAIQRVACVDDERHEGADALVIDVAVIGDDDYAVSGLQLIVC